MHPRSLAVLAAFAACVTSVTSASAAEPSCGHEADPAALTGTPSEIYTRARDAFSERRFADAVALFSYVADEHPESDVAIFAATLSLESIHLAGGDACNDALRVRAEKYRERYCTPALAQQSSESCATFARISHDLDRLGAERLVEVADHARGEKARRAYLEAGLAYAKLFQTGYADACKARDHDGCARAEEVVYNGARAYSAARDFSHATAMRRLLFSPEFHLDQTELGIRALYEQGVAEQSVAEYGQAAEHLERFAALAPKAVQAPDALTDAFVLHVALGELEEADRNFQEHSRAYGAKRPVDAAKMALALALEWDRVGDSATVARRVPVLASVIARHLPEQRPTVDVILGRAFVATKKDREAKAAFERAANADLRSAAIGDGDVAAMRALGRALTSVGEARLALADRERDAAMKLRLKKGDVAAYKAKREAIADAEKAYARVLDIAPMPPPGPVVAAAGRVGAMHARFLAEVYVALGAAATEPALAAARAANARCVDLGAKLQQADAGARACAHWLTHHFPADFAPMDELPPRFGGLGGPEAERPAALDEDSEPHVAEPRR